MKKINSSGFVMAETLIVTVFLTVIFAMLYSSFLPLAGEYEKREGYDNIDGKYAVFWIKRMIEDDSYDIPSTANMKEKGYVRFECSDITEDDEKRAFCIDMVKTLQVSGCNKKGDECDIFITRYRLENSSDNSRTWFKEAVKSDERRFQENCAVGNDENCKKQYICNCLSDKYEFGENNDCDVDSYDSADVKICTNKAEQRIFNTGFQDYTFFLPDFSATSLNYANYRVLARFQNKKDNNNYYSYATIEVGR